MTALKTISLIAFILPLAGCAAGAPRAPLGFDKRPANVSQVDRAAPSSPEVD